MIRSTVCSIILALVLLTVSAQNVPQLQKLKQYCKLSSPPGFDSTLENLSLFRGKELNYLYPLYQLFRGESAFRRQLGRSGYYDQLSQAICFTEDYQSSLQYALLGYDTLTPAGEKQIERTVASWKNVKYADARKYILFAANNYRVIMINEAHYKPLHRAFVISLLADFYKKGFRYLAMEMLNNTSSASPARLTAVSGYYCREPVAGELVRIALETGFTLVPYEDTLGERHTLTQRDSAQAAHIQGILLKDTAAKILVLAGYGHVAKIPLGDDYIPMALAFQRISKIPAFSIDQTDMTEESNLAYGRKLYQEFLQKNPLDHPGVAFVGNDPVNIANNQAYDLAIIHPPTTYRDGRPEWLSLNGLRKPTYIKPPGKGAFLVQAYYQSEMTAAGPGQLIPADQTYITTNKENFLLFLRKGKYIVVFRDIGYRLLGKQLIEVS